MDMDAALAQPTHCCDLLVSHECGPVLYYIFTIAIKDGEDGEVESMDRTGTGGKGREKDNGYSE
eukprot:571647-Pelagomonas_calceolata.AAC.1